VFVASSLVDVYAGQYQPEAVVVLRVPEMPTYVAIIGKIRTYELRDEVNVTIELELITEVDEST